MSHRKDETNKHLDAPPDLQNGRPYHKIQGTEYVRFILSEGFEDPAFSRLLALKKNWQACQVALINSYRSEQ